VTDRRIVVRSEFPGDAERSEFLTQLPPPVVRSAGLVTFGHRGVVAVFLASYGLRTNMLPIPAILLMGLEDPARVRDLIAASAEARRRSTT
jgi:hypothetical protein